MAKWPDIEALDRMVESFKRWFKKSGPDCRGLSDDDIMTLWRKWYAEQVREGNPDA